MKSAGYVSPKTPVIVFGLVVATAVLTTIFLVFLLSVVTLCGCAPEPPPEAQQQSG
jgi:hypothetical protein